MHHGVFSSIPGLYPLEASGKNPLSSWHNSKNLQTLLNVLLGQHHPQLITTGLDIDTRGCRVWGFRVYQPQHYGHLGLGNSSLWGCPVHHRILRSIPDLNPLDANSTSPWLWQLQISPHMAKCCPGCQITPIWEPTGFLVETDFASSGIRIT